MVASRNIGRRVGIVIDYQWLQIFTGNGVLLRNKVLQEPGAPGVQQLHLLLRQVEQSASELLHPTTKQKQNRRLVSF